MAPYFKLLLTLAILIIPSLGSAKELDAKRVQCLRALQKVQKEIVRVDYVDMQWITDGDSISLLHQQEGKSPEQAWSYAQWGADKVGSVPMEKLGGRSIPASGVIELTDKLIAAYLDKVRNIKVTNANARQIDEAYYQCEDLIESKTSNGKRSISDAVIEARSDLQQKFKTTLKSYSIKAVH